MLRGIVGRRLTLGLAGVAMAGFVAAQARADTDVDWTGFYAGAQLGGAWSNIDLQFQNANYFNTLGPTVVGNKIDNDPSGVIGGVLGGYNYQTGPWVFGLELTASAADMKEERPSPLFPKLDTNTSQINWLTTATGRLGYAWDRWLLYAKGGWAGGEVSVTLFDQSAGVYGSYDYSDLNFDDKTITCPNCNGVGAGFGTPIVDDDIKVQSVVGRLTFHQ